MEDELTFPDDAGFQPPHNEPAKRSARGHHRPWWNFNVIPLALALFPLTYLHHLWNVGPSVIFMCVFIIFLVWICMGCLGQMFRDQPDLHGCAPAPRLNWQIIFFVFILLGFFLTAFSIAGLMSRGTRSGSLMYLVSLGITTLPVLIVQIVGFTVVIRKRAKFPIMARYASFGLGGLIVVSLLTTLSPILGFSSFLVRQSNTATLAYFWSTTFFFSLICVICWVLIIMAMLADRRVE